MRGALRSAVAHLRAQGIWVVLGRAYLSAGALISSILLARLMTQEELGAYRLLLSGISLVGVLALPGVFEVLVRYIPRGEFELYSRLFGFRLKVSILSSIGFVGFCFFALDEFTAERVVPLALIALVLPLYFSSQMYEAVYQAQMQFRQLSTIYIGRTSLQTLGYLGAYVALGSVFQALAVMIGVMAAFHFWNHRRLKRNLAEKFDSAKTSRHVVNREALLISAFTILPSVMENIDKILIERSSGLDRLAVYSIGMALGLSVNASFKPFLNSINAKLVHHTPEPQHYTLILICGTCVGCMFSVISPYLVPFMYGEDYAESVFIAMVVTMSMGIFFWKTLYFNSAMFNHQKKLKVVFLSNICMAIGIIAYMFSIATFVQNSHNLLLMFAFAYPLKMILSILSLWVFGRVLK